MHDVSGAHILIYVVQVIAEQEDTLDVWYDRVVAFCDSACGEWEDGQIEHNERCLFSCNCCYCFTWRRLWSCQTIPLEMAIEILIINGHTDFSTVMVTIMYHFSLKSTKYCRRLSKPLTVPLYSPSSPLYNVPRTKEIDRVSRLIWPSATASCVSDVTCFPSTSRSSFSFRRTYSCCYFSRIHTYSIISI